MIRTFIEANTADPDNLSIRSLAEWYKTQLRQTSELTGPEKEYIEKRWVHLVTRLATQESVPVGWLSAAIFQLVEYELRLASTAVEEGTQALAAGGAEILGGS